MPAFTAGPFSLTDASRASPRRRQAVPFAAEEIRRKRTIAFAAYNKSAAHNIHVFRES
jgi:hypothetical protein